MTTIEYLSLPLHKKILVKFLAVICAIPKFFAKFFSKTVPNFFVNLAKKIANFFVELFNIFVDGDYKTRVSFIIMGFGQLSRGSIIRGSLNLIYEIAYIMFMILSGGRALMNLGTFGSVAKYTFTKEIIEENGSEKILDAVGANDNSLFILLVSIIALILTGILIHLWVAQVREASELQNNEMICKKASDKQTLNDLVGKNYHKVLLAIPTFGLVIFTILPLIIMIIVGFTNYSSKFDYPKMLFDWVGLHNFGVMFGISGSSGYQLAYVFGQVLLWTLIWAFFATFTNYFLGMGVALLINKKGIKFKKIWRTILITTIAVPQFISLLFMSKFLSTDQGALNEILKNWGWISQGIKFLDDGLIAKFTIIIVNMWIGIPYTMLMCSGLLMNIPTDLYESARIDGARPFKMYMKITLPYMLFVTGPYLISQFVGNINNFNVIYLLTGSSSGLGFTNINGVGITADIYQASQTDLLITWLYKIAMTNETKEYGLASVIGMCVFVVVASISLIFYSRSNAVKNEGDFQ